MTRELELYKEINKLSRELKGFLKRPQTAKMKTKVRVWQMDLIKKTNELNEIKKEREDGKV
jgi:hypothetical protein